MFLKCSLRDIHSLFIPPAALSQNGSQDKARKFNIRYCTCTYCKCSCYVSVLQKLYYSSSKANNSNLLKLTEEPKCYQNPTADVSTEQQDAHYNLGEQVFIYNTGVNLADLYKILIYNTCMQNVVTVYINVVLVN